ncbi:EAL domain-containing protein [Spiractinospora alimapuensis]|uniref:putative bifunctional diguanylate cyclase/phosphodiesterase n=1 Tax=Spiractinospora alimapuensis TaxID=2820884 RepID=UPI001F1D6C35|nr:EAL domain-containing protein [Spiractinospora alimapuensis]QVQ51619.1 EAL domain-containing protein [Spiractinospora alimapuensis]
MTNSTEARDLVPPRVGTPLWLYLTGTTIAGAVMLALAVYYWLGSTGLVYLATNPLTWVLLGLVIIGELRPISTTHQLVSSTAPTSLPFSFALVIAVGLPAAALVQTIATAAVGAARGVGPHRIGFTVAQYTLGFGVADAVLRLLEPSAASFMWVPETWADLLAVAAAAATYFVVTLLIGDCGEAMHLRQPLTHVLRAGLGQRVFTASVLLSLAPLVAVTMAWSVWLVPLFLFPLAALHSSAILSVKREHQANHDELTGLANRKLLNARAEAALQEARRLDHLVGLLLLDLDRFKEVNDTLGHPTGDRLLRAVAHRLTQSVRPGDLVARLGGDEFAVLLPHVRDSLSAREVAARLRVALAEPIRLEGMDFDLEASVGIALYPEHAADFELLLQRADVAMYVAKTRRTGVESYSAQKDHNSAARLSLFSELRRALVEDELEMLYQPTLGLAENRPVGLEALVRWRHPRRGLLRPEEFITLVEQSYVVRSFTQEILNQTLPQVARWWREGLRVPVAINFCARELLDPTLPDVIAAGLRRHSVPPEAIRLEISERILVTEHAAVLPNLLALSHMGLHLTLDDFGTGHFTLSQLPGLPINEVKIDGSLVGRIADATGGHAIVVSVVDLLGTLGMRVVAEGVEDVRVADALRDIGCYAAQGDFFSHPLAASEVRHWMDHHASNSGHRELPGSSIA